VRRGEALLAGSAEAGQHTLPRVPACAWVGGRHSSILAAPRPTVAAYRARWELRNA
jgi:hypothetical protein